MPTAEPTTEPSGDPTQEPTLVGLERYPLEHLVSITFTNNLSCSRYFGNDSAIDQSSLAIQNSYKTLIRLVVTRSESYEQLEVRVEGDEVCTSRSTVDVSVFFVLLSNAEEGAIRAKFSEKSDFYQSAIDNVENLFDDATVVISVITVVEFMVSDDGFLSILFSRYLSAVISIAFVFIFAVMACVGYIHKKLTFQKRPNFCSVAPFRPIDSVKYPKILSFGVSVLSTVTTLYFAYQCVEIGDVLSIVCGCCLVLVLLGSTIANLVHLSRLLKADILNESAKIWLSSHFKGVFVLVALSGSLCKSLTFSSSRWMGLNSMMCPLDIRSDANLFAFHVRYVLLMRCLPELLLEIAFIYLNINDTVFTFIGALSLLWSAINLVAGIAEVVQYRTHRNAHIRSFTLPLRMRNVNGLKKSEMDVKKIEFAKHYVACFSATIAKNYFGVATKFVRVYECIVDRTRNVLFFHGTVDDRALQSEEEGQRRSTDLLSGALVKFLKLEVVTFDQIEDVSELLGDTADTQITQITLKKQISDRAGGVVEALTLQFEVHRILQEQKATTNTAVMKKMKDLVETEMAEAGRKSKKSKHRKVESNTASNNFRV